MSDPEDDLEASVKATLLALVEESRRTYEEVARKLEEFDTRLFALEVLVDMLFTGPEDEDEQEAQKDH